MKGMAESLSKKLNNVNYSSSQSGGSNARGRGRAKGSSKSTPSDDKIPKDSVSGPSRIGIKG